MPTLTQLATSFARAHKAEGKSPHSIKLYRDCIRRLIVFAGEVLALVTRRTLTAFYAVRSETVAPGPSGLTGRSTGLPSSPRGQTRSARDPMGPDARLELTRRGCPLPRFSHGGSRRSSNIASLLDHIVVGNGSYVSLRDRGVVFSR